ncbi:MAG: CBS domain-containing protein [Roseovarius sp.]
MQIGKVMSCPVITATPGTTIRQAAERMRHFNVGTLPVIADDRAVGIVVGIVTDRDIVLRALATRGCARSLDTQIAQIMSRDVITCLEDDDVAATAALMGERQVRRLPVLTRSGALVGLLSVGDIAEHASEELAGQTLGEISEARARDMCGADIRPRRG